MALLKLEPLPPRTTKGELLALVCGAGLRREQVGTIDLQGTNALIEVPDGFENRLLKALDGCDFKNRRLRASCSRSGAVTDANDHFQRLASLLELESEAESQRVLENAANPDAQPTGDRIHGLIVAEESSGLGGRVVLTLAKRNRAQPLPWNRLEPGSPVLFSAVDSKGDEGQRGIVCERTRMELRVAFNEPPDDGQPATTFRLDLCADETSRQRQREALERTCAASRNRLAELRAVLLVTTAPAFQPETPLAPLDPALDESQRNAVAFALSARDIAVLHGPPGTGKTTALVEFIRQSVRRGQRVLACAPSNLAVDNLLERLLSRGENAVRLGHPARVLPELREHTLDLLVEDHENTRQARKLAKKAFGLFRQAGKWTRAKPEPGTRQQLRQEGRALLDDARKLEAQAIDRILNGASIVCSTLTGLDSAILGQRQFDIAVIDEAGQCVEPACWLPILRSHCVVLAGDHCQLPPTILSQEALAQGFGVSLMERLVTLFGPHVTRRLNVQYRMHDAIMQFSSQEFYDSSLTAHDSVRGHLLTDLPGVSQTPLTQSPVHFIDTAGAGFVEEQEASGTSRFNPQEADVIARKTRLLLEAGVCADRVAIIAPYAAQVRVLREKLPIPGLEIDSVDGFQGREKEAVLLSLVRSNPDGDVGFLSDIRRINVALTRARRNLIVVGDSATLSNHPFYERLFAYFDAIGAYHSVWDEGD